MAQLGIAGYLYDLQVESGDAHFTFTDPQDASNTEEVVIAAKDFPEGITDPTSREVSDIAYLQCAKLLNDKRDERIRSEAAAKLEADAAAEAARREAAQDYLTHIQDPATEPDHVEKDGTRVFTVPQRGSADASSASSADNSGKKK